MARIPLKQIETGPIIAPALQAASQIREGRARAAITEETARTYPQERRARLSILGERAERAPVETEAAREGIRASEQKREIAGKKEERAERQAPLAEEQANLQNAKARLGVISNTLSQVASPDQYQRATQWLEENGIAPPGGFDELPEDARTREGFVEYRNKFLLPELGQKERELDLREQGYRTQLEVADKYTQSQEAQAAARAAAQKAQRAGVSETTIRRLLDDSKRAWKDENLRVIADNYGDPSVPEERKPGYKPYDEWIDDYMQRSIKNIVGAKEYSRQIGQQGEQPAANWRDFYNAQGNP